MNTPSPDNRKKTGSTTNARHGDSACLNVLFVGGFGTMKDGKVGGTVVACRSLIDSPYLSRVKWLLLDSTMETLPPPPLFRRLWKAFCRLGKFVCYLAAKNIDAILIFSSTGLSFVEKGFMAKVASLVGKKVCFSPRSGNIEDLTRESNLFRIYARWALRGCHRIICQSLKWQNFFQGLTGLPAERFVVVPNWIDVSKYGRARPPASGGTASCLYMGALLKAKGIYDLLEAIRLRKDDLGPIRFLLAGDGPEREGVLKMIGEYGLEQLVAPIGWVDGQQKSEILDEADIFVFPSHSEGMPNALLEAMASGCACIATRVGACQEMIPDDSFGLLVEAGDIPALGEKLVYLVNNPTRRAAFGTAARERVINEYNLALASDKLFSALSSARRLTVSGSGELPG